MDALTPIEAARGLIVGKHHEAARAVLETIPDDETARRWLARLNEIAPEASAQPPVKQKRARPLVIAGILFAVAAAFIIGIMVIVQMTNNYRWSSQYSEAVVTLKIFCQYNLTGVGDDACQNWAYQTVNADLSSTDAILLCNRVFWNGSSSGRDQDAFVSCLARAGVYIPQ